MSEEEFVAMLDPLRDPQIWEKGPGGQWRTKDHIGNHLQDPGVEEVRLPLDPARRGFMRSRPRRTYPRDDHIDEFESLNAQKEYVIL
jgi:hypothetical protein